MTRRQALWYAGALLVGVYLAVPHRAVPHNGIVGARAVSPEAVPALHAAAPNAQLATREVSMASQEAEPDGQAPRIYAASGVTSFR